MRACVKVEGSWIGEPTLLDRQELVFDITCVSVDGNNAAGLTESFGDVANCCPELVPLVPLEQERIFHEAIRYANRF